MSIVKFEFSYDTVSKEFSVTNVETGEVKSTKVVKKTSKNKKEESTEPLLTLEENKYYLTPAAIELMQVEPGDKLDIKYEKQGRNSIPVIGSDEVWGTKSGNKLNKSLTVACRGSKQEELSKYGNQFTIIPHNSKEGLFILKGNKEIDEEIENIEDITTSIIEEDNLQNIIDDPDVTEVSPFTFQL